MATIKQNRGFTLLEVLITLIIMAVGLLGIAALHSRAQQAELESYQRSQALILLEDIVNRVRTNASVADCYETTAIGTGADPAASCAVTPAPGTAAAREQAAADLVAWDGLLEGGTEQLDGADVGAMIGARGCISIAPSGVYTAAVVWQGMSATVAPGNTCGAGSYGDETRRRAVTTDFRVPDLK